MPQSLGALPQTHDFWVLSRLCRGVPRVILRAGPLILVTVLLRSVELQLTVVEPQPTQSTAHHVGIGVACAPSRPTSVHNSEASPCRLPYHSSQGEVFEDQLQTL